MSRLITLSRWAASEGAKDLAKAVLYLFVGVPIFAVLLRFFGVLPQNWAFPSVSQVQWLSGGILITFGILIGLSSAIIAFGRQIGDARVEALGDRLDAAVSEFEETLLKAHFGELWLSHPWEYQEYLNQVDRDYEARHCGHVNKITLYGTMVGFSFLLPEALFQHVKRTDDFKQLRIVASNTKTRLVRNGTVEELSCFPLYLVAKLGSLLFDSSSDFYETLKRRDFEIIICYVEHDMLSAAIVCRGMKSGVEAATLQALDSAVFERILKGEELQPGFRYSNTSHEDAFDRVEAVLDNVASQFRQSAVDDTGKRKNEHWKFSWDRSKPKLTVTNPHWSVDDENEPKRITTLDGASYYTAREDCLVLCGKEEIRNICNLLVQCLEKNDRIKDLKQIVETHSKDGWRTGKEARRSYRNAGAPPSN